MWHSWKIKKGHRDDFFRDLKCQITRLVEVGNRPLIAVSWNFISPHFNLFRKFFNKLNYKFRTSDIVSICRKCSQKYRTNRILNVGQYWQITNPKFNTLFLCWIIITTQGKKRVHWTVLKLYCIESGWSQIWTMSQYSADVMKIVRLYLFIETTGDLTTIKQVQFELSSRNWKKEKRHECFNQPQSYYISHSINLHSSLSNHRMKNNLSQPLSN